MKFSAIFLTSTALAKQYAFISSLHYPPKAFYINPGDCVNLDISVYRVKIPNGLKVIIHEGPNCKGKQISWGYEDWFKPYDDYNYIKKSLYFDTIEPRLSPEKIEKAAKAMLHFNPSSIFNVK
jgi:hypothetical protein